MHTLPKAPRPIDRIVVKLSNFIGAAGPVVVVLRSCSWLLVMELWLLPIAWRCGDQLLMMLQLLMAHGALSRRYLHGRLLTHTTYQASVVDRRRHMHPGLAAHGKN